MTVMAMILGMTDMTCDPRLIWKPVNPLTILFYAGYTVLCLMPLGLELWMEHQLLKLASRTAFRKGTSTYCGYENAVEPGMWVGGIVGLKSILDVRNREKALQIMEELQKLGYVTYTLEP